MILSFLKKIYISTIFPKVTNILKDFPESQNSSKRSHFPRNHHSRKINSPRKSLLPRSHFSQEVIFSSSRKVTFPGKSLFPGGQFSREVNCPGKSLFPGSYFSREVTFTYATMPLWPQNTSMSKMGRTDGRTQTNYDLSLIHISEPTRPY